MSLLVFCSLFSVALVSLAGGFFTEEIGGAVASEVNHYFLEHYARIKRREGEELETVGVCFRRVGVTDSLWNRKGDSFLHYAAGDGGIEDVIDILGRFV